MKELIGNEGDIHVTYNHSEGEQVTETHVHAESVLYRQMRTVKGVRVFLNPERSIKSALFSLGHVHSENKHMSKNFTKTGSYRRRI